MIEYSLIVNNQGSAPMNLRNCSDAMSKRFKGYWHWEKQPNKSYVALDKDRNLLAVAKPIK